MNLLFAIFFHLREQSQNKKARLIMSNSTRSLIGSSYDFGSCGSTQSSSIAEELRTVKGREIGMVDYRNCSVLQCVTCNTVLGDSLSICGEVQSLQSIISFSVTEAVRVNKKLEMSLNGPLASSIYQALHCAGCLGSVGLVLHSTPEHLSVLRNLFLLRKELINCYILRSGTCVNASKLDFKHRLMDKTIKEMKQDLQAQLKQVEMLEGMVGKLNVD